VPVARGASIFFYTVLNQTACNFSVLTTNPSRLLCSPAEKKGSVITSGLALIPAIQTGLTV
jgi:hypothetical protein